QVATVLIATGGECWSEEKIRERALTCRKLPEPFSMEEIAKTYRPGKFRDDSPAMFRDHLSGNGFLHDVELENRQNSKARRYPITNVS
ncbi:MAG: hypothetical protein HN907_08265, partial [Nitrospina sp.]|nr:hypothetical protein [Nitrospina sp.]